jgi:large repetitive protein
VWYFREAMEKPVLSSPEDGFPITDLRPTFNWGDVPGASSYTIQVSINSSMSSPIVNATVTPSSYLPTKDLTKNRTLYWRVKANGANGPSAWSDKHTFFINLPLL